MTAPLVLKWGVLLPASIFFSHARRACTVASAAICSSIVMVFPLWLPSIVAPNAAGDADLAPAVRYGLRPAHGCFYGPYHQLGNRPYQRVKPVRTVIKEHKAVLLGLARAGAPTGARGDNACLGAALGSMPTPIRSRSGALTMHSCSICARFHSAPSTSSRSSAFNSCRPSSVPSYGLMTVSM